MKYRTEKDLLGEKLIPEEALYGIHTARAHENFPVSGYRQEPVFIKAFGYVKKACILTNMELGYLGGDFCGYILQAVDELIDSQLDEHIIVDALQGGAGTSTNMNVNEVIANRALELAGRKKGEYDLIHPLKHINMHQSTNDVFPTAMKVAALILLNDAETAVTELQAELQKKEHEFAHILKTGRTELQDAVPVTMGRVFSAFAEAVSRDRWRIFKSRERIRVINLGGTMIGTGISAPRDYIFLATETLRDLTGFNLSRGENLIDSTQNHDPFVEVSGIMKAHAVTIRKMANDLRLLSAGPHSGYGEIQLEPLQAGSSIMPGKVNPVIPEMLEQCAVKIFANDQIVTETASRGELELNAFLPLLNMAFLESLRLIINMDTLLLDKCLSTIKVNEEQCDRHVRSGFGALVGLLPRFGYDTVQEIASRAAQSHRPPSEIIKEMGLMTDAEIDQFLSPHNFSQLGYDPPEKKGDSGYADNS
ncbi:MAG: aspartate ammonia-lyase [Candidatus Auribacterota bacterium]